MGQRVRISLSRLQTVVIVILLVSPLVLLTILEILLPDEGQVQATVLDRIFWTITVIVIAVVVTAVSLVFTRSRRYLLDPMRIMSDRLKEFAAGRPVVARERFPVRELDDLSESINDLMDAFLTREESLQRINEDLESTVREKTAELQESAADLQSARDQLMMSEKMAVLGSLVAGVAHELNSPLSIGVTAASFLNDRARSLVDDYNELSLTQENLERFLADSEESSRIIQDHLDLAARILGSLKQVAADQQGDEHRPFELGAYVNDVLLSLNHETRSGKHRIIAEADGAITVDTYPGALTQVLNNLVFNSLMHGFENRSGGEIRIRMEKDGTDAVLRYSDNGRGLTDEESARLFEQYFTTRLGRGGTGLGMGIVRDLVEESLGGSIELAPPESGGTGFLIRFPVDCTGGRE